MGNPKEPPPPPGHLGPLERGCVREGAFFGSLSEDPLPKGGGLERGLLPPPSPGTFFSPHPN